MVDSNFLWMDYREFPLFIFNLHIQICLLKHICFPGSLASKKSTCNTGDPGSIPGLGRSTGKGIGYPLRYSWASLVAKPINNLPAMWETCFQSMGCEDPLEKRKATHSSILFWRIPWTV